MAYSNIPKPTTEYEDNYTSLWSRYLLPWVSSYFPWSHGTAQNPTYSNIDKPATTYSSINKPI